MKSYKELFVSRPGPIKYLYDQIKALQTATDGRYTNAEIDAKLALKADKT